jgi:hypothetical protein
MVNFSDFEDEMRFHELWESVRLERPVHYNLFTFGDTVLPYYFVGTPTEENEMVSLVKGEVRVARPMIITPDTARPEFQNFFDEQGDQGMIDFLLSRSAAFSHLKFENNSRSEKFLSDQAEEVVSKLNKQLDSEEEEETAILSAIKPLAGIALLKYTADRVLSSAPGNVQELRERGFLP